MNEDKLFQLLGKILETNTAVLAQNERFLEQHERALAQHQETIDFLKERDAGLSTRTALEIERLTQSNRQEKIEAEYAAWVRGLQKEDHEAHEAAYRALGATRTEIIMTKEIGNLRYTYEESKKWLEDAKRKAAGLPPLPEKP